MGKTHMHNLTRGKHRASAYVAIAHLQEGNPHTYPDTWKTCEVKTSSCPLSFYDHDCPVLHVSCSSTHVAFTLGHAWIPTRVEIWDVDILALRLLASRVFSSAANLPPFTQEQGASSSWKSQILDRSFSGEIIDINLRKSQGLLKENCKEFWRKIAREKKFCRARGIFFGFTRVRKNGVGIGKG